MSQPNLFTAEPPKVPTVTELTGLIKDLLETSFQNVDVEGEISKPVLSSSGHLYFTLKDSGAQMPCVMWRSTYQRLSFKPAHGQQVQLTGDVQLYAPHGKYQLIVRSARQAGLGALQQAFEKLKQKLQDEGLFDSHHKKQLPPFPNVVGIVTSAQGAALQDVISTFEKRYPMITLRVYHAAVQGVQAAPQIARGVNFFATQPETDVVIVTRGGGSLEDLWPFNEEVVARAIFNCPVPVISAVGHETDFSISDFVADVRAATPTQAVALMVPDLNDLRFQVEELNRSVHFRMEQRLQRAKDRIQALAKTYALHAVMENVQRQRTHIDHLSKKALSITEMMLVQNQRKIEQLQSRLSQQNPNQPLELGYSRVWQGDEWIRKASDFKKGKPVRIEWKDNKLDV